MSRFILKIAIILLIVLTQINLVDASPLVVRCSTERTSLAGHAIKVQIDISLPQSMDKVLSSNDANMDGEALYYSRVGRGVIEITEGKRSHRHDFIITRMPEGSNSLIGFYLDHTYIRTIRADLWDDKKPFIYFDTYNNEALKGECQ